MRWSDIRGHDRPKSILQRALETGRVHHAYLFAGQRGVGKYTTARVFSAVVNCQARDEGEFRDVCGECSSCRKIAEGYHPDVVTIAPENGSSTIKIEQIRDIQDSATKQPHEGRCRMVMIDEAHEMSTQAANALLKTLEEPMTAMRMILVTDRSHQLLETILSRCQTIRFGGLEREDIRDVLEEKAADADWSDEVGEEDLDLAAGYGGGSLGRALEIVQSGLLDQRRNLVRRTIDPSGSEPSEMLDWAEELSDDRSTLDDKLDVLKLFFRDLSFYKVRGADASLVNPDLEELLESYRSAFELDEIADAIDRIGETQRELDRHVNPQLLMENLLPELRPS